MSWNILIQIFGCDHLNDFINISLIIALMILGISDEYNEFQMQITKEL